MTSIIVKDVFSKGYQSVREEDRLSSCLSLFKKKAPPILVVLDSKGRYKSVLARRWILRSKLDPSKAKVKTLMRPAPKVALADSLSRVAKLMIESGIRQLPVYGKDDLLGFVTDEEVIHGAVMKKWGDTKVEEIMTKKPFVVEEDEPLGSILNLFREQDISHVPVIRDGKLVGIISVHDIIEYFYKPEKRVGVDARREKVRSLSVPVKSLMVKPVVTVTPETKLKNAVDKMRDFDIASLIVVRKSRPLGVLTKRDFLELIAQLEEVKRRLTIQFSVKGIQINEFKRDLIINEFESFARRFRESLGSGTLFVYMKPHGTNYKGNQIIHCRLQVRTRKGTFFSSNEGWNIEQTFSIALDKLEKQILRSKKLDYDPEFAQKYLRLLDFPLTEL